MSSNNQWKTVIGLEVHAQVVSNSKLFSSSPVSFGAEPNSMVSWFDAAMPGTLPVLNEFCVRQAVKTALGLNAQVNLFSAFDRKHYFYPDLPSGYQISQFYHPIASNGFIAINDLEGSEKKIRINRIHLEQDAGKSLHDQDPLHSFVDLNRAGVALMEIVTEPDLSSTAEVEQYLRKLRSLLRYLGTCDGDMDKGSMRCDANVSVHLAGEPLGTRCEIKNLNSVKHVAKAIEYEVKRQIQMKESGKEVQQETRLFDLASGKTKLMRSKEDALDYRYFPDPDLPPVVLEESYVSSVKLELPELPDQKIARYTESLGITAYDAKVLTEDKLVADYFESVAGAVDPKQAANWIMGELFSYLNEEGISIDKSAISAKHLAELINLIKDGTISGKIAKEVFKEMRSTSSSPIQIVEDKNLTKVSDPILIEAIIDRILSDNQDTVALYLEGKTRSFGFLVGQAIKLSEGKADPKLINDVLKQKLEALPK